MLNQQTIEQLRTLRLDAMARAFGEQLEQPVFRELSFEERFSMIVLKEVTERDNRRLAKLLKAARLRQPACVEDIDFRHPRGLDKPNLLSLATCDWVRRRHNLHITGLTGTGKSWLACAFGNQACRLGLSVRYERVPRLLDQLRIARADGSFGKRLVALAKTDLLILDDFGIKPLGKSEKHDLLEIVEDRHDRRSTLITSQLPIAQWHEYLGEPTVADALLDRVLHNSHRLELIGESMRRNVPRLDKKSGDAKE
jgi:DNA replication protein DnaC